MTSIEKPILAVFLGLALAAGIFFLTAPASFAWESRGSQLNDESNSSISKDEYRSDYGV